MQIFSEPEKDQWPTILARPNADGTQVEETVRTILDDVKLNGMAAVKKYSELFDGISIDNYFVTEAEFAAASALISEKLKAAINIAKNNITRFHEAQKEELKIVETMPGLQCWRKSVPVQKIGLYIPGGSAPLFSTLLMLGIPAKIAGCSDIIICTPCDKNGNIHPAILYTASLLEIKNICKVGGAQAIAAMAYGTENVQPVYKIFGPGNRYVTVAKQLVNKEGIAIDMPAGPSEVAIYADETAVAAFVAADLLSQAEHGIDSQVLLVATNEGIVKSVQAALSSQVEVLPRKEIAAKALQNSRAIIIQNSETAFELLNEYAPEHLIIASTNAAFLAGKVANAGSVFLGNFSPESVGDYASGTNHTLPTNGFAKAYSGVSLDSFVKKITFQQLTEEGLLNIGNAVSSMAAAEGLDAHRNSVDIRLAYLNK